MTVYHDINLPKGQVKSLESLLFVPPGNQNVSETCQFNAGRGGSRVVNLPRERLMGLMPSWQYHFVVLAKSSELYSYIERLPSINPPSSLDYSEAPYYRVALLGGDRRTPLPSNREPVYRHRVRALGRRHAHRARSSPAAGDARLAALGRAIDPQRSRHARLTPDQGFYTLFARNSDGPCKLDGSSLAALNTFFDKISRQLAPAHPWSGVRLKKHPQAEFVPGAGQLLIERRVGRGRVVVSAFRLSNHEFTDWPGCDGVFNAMLLRRPPREYVENSDATVRLGWADHGSRLDAARVTQLRYFARDTGVPFASYASDVRGRNVDVDESNANAPMAIDLPTPAPGIAAWNDFNPIAQAAHQSLQSTARIEIPKSSFVLWVVAVYLVVLVPVNWAVFRSLRRSSGHGSPRR